ncbi:putative ribonuclease H protein, partial [Trifolium medium]|nr:putative ribonuclease H protein [Trifolium medium]
MGNWLDGEWRWDFRWRRELSVWEIELLHSLLSVMAKPLLLGATDSWSWRHDSSGTFSVKSAYLLLSAGV